MFRGGRFQLVVRKGSAAHLALRAVRSVVRLMAANAVAARFARKSRRRTDEDEVREFRVSWHRPEPPSPSAGSAYYPQYQCRVLFGRTARQDQPCWLDRASPLSVNDASPHIMGWPKQPLHYHCACRLTPGHKIT